MQHRIPLSTNFKILDHLSASASTTYTETWSFTSFNQRYDQSLSEQVYKKNYSDKNANRVNWIKAMVKYPILMERPIVVSGDKAVIGRPPTLVLDL